MRCVTVFLTLVWAVNAKIPMTMERFELMPESPEQRFTSPGFPEPAPANTKHQWIIMGVPNSVITIRCATINLLGLCGDNNITIEDGRLGGLICGDSYANQEYVHTSAESMLILTLSSGPRGQSVVDCSATSSLRWGPMPTYLDTPSVEVESSEYGVKKPENTPTTCPCGWANKQSKSRIIGGTETGINEYPWVASLIEIKKRTATGIVYARFCGGTIISAWHVLTAAHCTIDFVNRPTDIAVIVGDHDHTKWDETDANKAVKIDKVVIHTKYNDKKTKYDISLITTAEEIIFTDKVGPACLPTAQQDMVGQDLKGLGWGLTAYPGKSSNVLMQVWLKVISLEECRNLYVGSVDMIYEHQLCLFNKNKGLCMGDSGGPLVWRDPKTNMYTLSGIVSFGKKCSVLYPDVVTDVAYFLPWINQNIQNSKPTNTCAAQN